MKNEISELTKDEIKTIKSILNIIEFFLITNGNSTYIEHFFRRDRFKEIDEISLIRLLKKLDEKFGIITFMPRKNTNEAYIIALKDRQDPKDFLKFKEEFDLLDDQKDPLKSIHILGTQNSQDFEFVINENYLKPIQQNYKTKYWGLLFKLVNSSPAYYSQNRDQYKNIIKKESFPFKDFAKYTPILTKNGDEIKATIPIKFITQKQFNSRQRAQKMKS